MISSLVQAVEQHIDLLREYYILELREELSEQEGKRLCEILKLAENDDFIDLMLSEIDYVIANRKGYLSDEYKQKYNNQISWLREYLIPDLRSEREKCTRLQNLLEKVGIYDGPKDGFFGDQTLRALESFQIREQLQVDGLNGPETKARLEKSAYEKEKATGFR